MFCAWDINTVDDTWECIGRIYKICISCHVIWFRIKSLYEPVCFQVSYFADEDCDDICISLHHFQIRSVSH